MPTIIGVRAGRSGSIKLASDKVVSQYQLIFAVRADNKYQGPLAIRQTTGLPFVGLSTYSYSGESDPTAICKSKTPKQNPKQPVFWEVTCDFDNDPTRSQEDESSLPGATSRPPIIEWDAELGEIVMEKSLDSPAKDVLNVNFELFDPPAMRPICHPVLVYRRYQSTFTASTITTYVNKTNSNAGFYGVDEGQALMTSIRARQVIEDGVKLWDVEYRVRFALEEPYHDLQLLNYGYKVRTSPSAPITDSPRSVNLQMDGTKLPDAAPRVFLSFQRHKRVDFSPLSLT